MMTRSGQGSPLMYPPTTWQIINFWNIQTERQLAPPLDLAGYRAPSPPAASVPGQCAAGGEQSERVWGTPEHRVGKFRAVTDIS